MTNLLDGKIKSSTDTRKHSATYRISQNINIVIFCTALFEELFFL